MDKLTDCDIISSYFIIFHRNLEGTWIEMEDKRITSNHVQRRRDGDVWGFVETIARARPSSKLSWVATSCLGWVAAYWIAVHVILMILSKLGTRPGELPRSCSICSTSSTCSFDSADFLKFLRSTNIIPHPRWNPHGQRCFPSCSFRPPVCPSVPRLMFWGGWHWEYVPKKMQKKPSPNRSRKSLERSS